MSGDESYEIPLQDQRVFGAGIKRQRVKFVRPTPSSSIQASTSSTPAKSISDLYLSLVLPSAGSSADIRVRASSPAKPPSESAESNPKLAQVPLEPKLCDICKLPLSTADDEVAISSTGTLESNQRPTTKPRPHEASLAHQVCLTHSHPPSHLDRNRKGLAYLSAYGWNPDARVGLGIEGQGIKFPIKPKPKNDKLGIGVVLPKPGEIRKREKPEKLDAGRVRKMYEKDKKKSEKLREMFYCNDDMKRYLGGG